MHLDTGIPRAERVSLIGATVSGALYFDNKQNKNKDNWFDNTQKGSVPSGYGNSAPATPKDLLVKDDQVEFGFESTNKKTKVTVDILSRGLITLKVRRLRRRGGCLGLGQNHYQQRSLQNRQGHRSGEVPKQRLHLQAYGKPA